MTGQATAVETSRLSLDEQFMRNAMAIALDGTRQNEVPIGAVIVRGGSIVAGANNRTVATLLGAGGEAPVITKKPEGAYSLKLTEGLK